VTILEAIVTSQCRRKKQILIKCTECKNTFTTESPKDGDTVCCPVCEAQYKAVVSDGKLRLEESLWGENDLGEL